MSNPEILVTGATGTSGGALLRQLSRAGIAVRALVRDKEKAAHLASDLVELVEGDLDDQASLEEAMTGIRAAYLNILPFGGALDQVDRFLAAAKSRGVRHVVKLSGLNASLQSPSATIRLHAAANEKIVASGLGYTILNANSFYQNILSQLDGIRATGQFYLPLGDAQQSLVDVEDVGAVAARVLADPDAASGVLELTGPQSLTFRDVATALGRAFGREVSYAPITSEAFRGVLLSNGAPEPVARDVAELFQVFAAGDYAEVTGDVARVLGRQPRSIDDFAAALAA